VEPPFEFGAPEAGALSLPLVAPDELALPFFADPAEDVLPDCCAPLPFWAFVPEVGVLLLVPLVGCEPAPELEPELELGAPLSFWLLLAMESVGAAGAADGGPEG